MSKFIINETCETGGNGLWSGKKTSVYLTHMVESVWGVDGYEVYFDTKTWDVRKDGLIYTDETFLNNLKAILIDRGYTPSGVKELSYTEQGMQGEDFVSIETGVGGTFGKEFLSD